MQTDSLHFYAAWRRSPQRKEKSDVGAGVGLTQVHRPFGECWLEVKSLQTELLMQLWCHTDCKSSVL